MRYDYQWKYLIELKLIYPDGIGFVFVCTTGTVFIYLYLCSIPKWIFINLSESTQCFCWHIFSIRIFVCHSLRMFCMHCALKDFSFAGWYFLSLSFSQLVFVLLRFFYYYFFQLYFCCCFFLGSWMCNNILALIPTQKSSRSFVSIHGNIVSI